MLRRLEQIQHEVQPGQMHFRRDFRRIPRISCHPTGNRNKPKTDLYANQSAIPYAGEVCLCRNDLSLQILTILPIPRNQSFD